jgi:hypothetical protein
LEIDLCFSTGPEVLELIDAYSVWPLLPTLERGMRPALHFVQQHRIEQLMFRRLGLAIRADLFCKSWSRRQSTLATTA